MSVYYVLFRLALFSHIATVYAVSHSIVLISRLKDLTSLPPYDLQSA